MKALFLLCKKSEFDFLLIFENLVERCNESKNEDMALIFFKNLEVLSLTYLPERLTALLIDILKNELFSCNKECIMHLLSFMQSIILISPQTNPELTKAIFYYVCKNMRNFYTDIRKKSVDVFCCLNFKSLEEEKLMMTLQKEKFEDYQPTKNKNSNHLNNKNYQNQNQANNNQANNNYKVNQKHKGVENKTEKQMEAKELKQINENGLIGSILFVLEDELPEIRISSIRALVVLGKLNSVSKYVDIKELLLYFLNDDFDQVRIKSLLALQELYSEIAFSDFELETMQFNLKEQYYELRVAIYKLLGNFAPKKSSQ